MLILVSGKRIKRNVYRIPFQDPREGPGRGRA